MFMHIAIHTPKPEHRDDVIASMQRAGAASDGAEGLLQMGPWLEIDGGRLVGLAIWESREAFLAAAPASSRLSATTRSTSGKPSRSRASSSRRPRPQASGRLTRPTEAQGF